MTILKYCFVITVCSIFIISCKGNKTESEIVRTKEVTSSLKPVYDVPYGKPSVDSIVSLLNRIDRYLDSVTPMKVVNKYTSTEVTDYSKFDSNAVFAKSDYKIISYEWGVTYAGMLLAGEVTGNKNFKGYTDKRLNFISRLYPFYVNQSNTNPGRITPLRSVVEPRALDDAGSMCTAMIKAHLKGLGGNLEPIIKNYIDYISTKQFRLQNGILARTNPQPKTLWLDDLFMSVPALAFMGRLTGEKKYFDDACKQVMEYSKRMFNWKKGLFIHGWVQDMDIHPEFHWARANGWAFMAMVELLEVLPGDHSDRADILKLLRTHINGLASYQSPQGFWHQLLDRSDSYLETSATAIFCYAIARSINRGYIDASAFGPVALLAWNAVSTKINKLGQIEDVCIGTMMGFDPAFYYCRPKNVYAAHGYGPTLLAGAEIISLINNFRIEDNDIAIQFYPKH